MQGHEGQNGMKGLERPCMTVQMTNGPYEAVLPKNRASCHGQKPRPQIALSDTRQRVNGTNVNARLQNVKPTGQLFQCPLVMVQPVKGLRRLGTKGAKD